MILTLCDCKTYQALHDRRIRPVGYISRYSMLTYAISREGTSGYREVNGVALSNGNALPSNNPAVKDNPRTYALRSRVGPPARHPPQIASPSCGPLRPFAFVLQPNPTLSDGPQGVRANGL